MKSKFNVFLLIIFLVLCVMFELDSETKAGSIAERPSAVIVAYHRFGEPQFPSTNIRIEQFKSHILELQKEKYNVLPITEIIQKISNKESLLVITKSPTSSCSIFFSNPGSCSYY